MRCQSNNIHQQDVNLLTADTTKFRMAVPPPNTMERVEVRMDMMRLMLPRITAHTDSNTCNMT